MALSEFQHRRRVLLALAIFTIAIPLLFIRSSWEPESHIVRQSIEAVGMGLIAIGVLGRLWCTLHIGGRKAAEIVASGPYSMSRNPLYFFSSVAALGVGAQSGSLLLAFLFCAGSVAAFHVVIRREERFLVDAFGAQYRTYCERVPRLFPNPLLFRDEPTVLVKTDRLYKTLADGLVFFVPKPAFEFIEVMQSVGSIPVFLHLI